MQIRGLKFGGPTRIISLVAVQDRAPDWVRIPSALKARTSANKVLGARFRSPRIEGSPASSRRDDKRAAKLKPALKSQQKFNEPAVQNGRSANKGE
jgi:hypothetical protein